MVFDFGVNAGPGRSIKMLQGCVGVAADGAFGPKTLAAVVQANPARLIEVLAKARMTYYRSLSTFDTFGLGWTRRTDSTKAKALEMAGAGGLGLCLAPWAGDARSSCG
ncbi:putative peptidoglycan-binding domain-containing protein [Roseomonas populi]|uniref:Peptidoglycan binding domain-containing protein n=1 Tax=Roseomonas populi TaxID=3121582 RepID=A0ABT1X0Z7_9PROT|nr:putative peptidoglycan-binding domain-containing protein [Roseomonas pecuniae]MCR0981775.1 hypothetical protein [Roseomonas pecuniae]